MKKLSYLLVAAALAGCAHTAPDRAGDPSPPLHTLSAQRVAQVLVKGKTTKEELVAAFGAPNSVEKNRYLPTREMLAKAKGPLPPIASTVEFWNYWSVPQKELENAAATGGKAKVFRLMVFLDAKGTAVDYQTAETEADLGNPPS